MRSKIDKLKSEAAYAAVGYLRDGQCLGIGSGSTVACFIHHLAKTKTRVGACVASSEESSRLLRHHGLTVVKFNEVDKLDLYVDGADESNQWLELIKGGKGALGQEKVLAYSSDRFVCIVHEEKLVHTLGKFPLSLEVLPMAWRSIAGIMSSRFGSRVSKRQGFVTDNGNIILDVHGLDIQNPKKMESLLNQIPGVLCVGIFARRRADILILAGEDGVRTIYQR